ncbi:3-phytase A [Podospora fimiseda]|uniref:3-phytase n=1 Tax=Podospora fimiseda TaxID=252190 RepID=A0AAN7BGK2_9PEZI|nr:3-phytase A [Podospora fimiseda]
MTFESAMDSLRSLLHRSSNKSAIYTSIPDDDNQENVSSGQNHRRQTIKKKINLVISAMILIFLGILTVLFLQVFFIPSPHTTFTNPSPSKTTASPIKCDTPSQGYQCDTSISHSWELDSSIPTNCHLTFAQILSRHGARDPTFGKTIQYASLITRIQETTTSYKPGYEFLHSYNYSLGSDQLTSFGQQQLYNSGIKFYSRYKSLFPTKPFIRAADQDRVVMSAQNFTSGFHHALLSDRTHSRPPPKYDYPIQKIPEGDVPNTNNTLSHGLCKAFEKPGKYSTLGAEAQAVYTSTFIPAITARLNSNLINANLSDADAISLMDMCPFTTVAESEYSKDFCSLFTESEWEKYDYYQDLGKYYGYGPGNPLGPTQGVGWVNELIARLTGSPVRDETSTNRTLDGNEETFPLGRKVYWDFSHDNDMVGVLGALGVWEGVEELNKEGKKGNTGERFKAAESVAFGARVYVEKMRCEDRKEEVVRVLVNDRVVGFRGCEEGGMCIVILVLLLALLGAGIGFVFYTRIRASQLGLPPPGFTSYIPFFGSSSTSSYSGPSPAPGGIKGWINDRVRTFRNKRTAVGAYEGSSAYNGGYNTGRGGGRFDEDAAWDSRVNDNPYEEERELGLQPPAVGGAAGQWGGRQPQGEGYQMNMPRDEERERGRTRSRSPGPATAAANPFEDPVRRNPFGDDNELRGVSPRPIIDTTGVGNSGKGGKDGDSPTERKSIFRENVIFFDIYYKMATEINLPEIRDVLVSLAFEAGRMILNANPSATAADTKLNAVDIVTETDKAVETLISTKLTSLYPSFSFIGEETYVKGQTTVTDSPTFIVDPIDGTQNFVHGFPHACVSLGFTLGKAPSVGVVYNPFLDIIYTAVKGQGAYMQRNASSPVNPGEKQRLPLNGGKGKLNQLKNSLVAFEGGSQRDGENFEIKMKAFRNLLSAEKGMVGGFRSLGSSALNICGVAAGQLDLYWEGGCYAWDVAAGWCILEEAGGKMYGGNRGVWEPELDSRKYLCVRGSPENEGQEEIVEEFWGLLEGDMVYEH